MLLLLSWFLWLPKKYEQQLVKVIIVKPQLGFEWSGRSEFGFIYIYLDRYICIHCMYMYVY